MTAEDLLAKLEKGELVAPEIIASLRRQIANAKEPIAPAAVAKLLVDKGHLTAGQAARLLEQTGASQIKSGTSQIAKKPAAAPPAPAKSPAPALHSSSVHDDLGLAPLDDLEPLSSPASSLPKSPTPPAAKSAIKSAAAPVAPSANLEDLGLAPLEDLDPISSPPPAAAAKSAIQKATPPPSAIQKGPAKPTTATTPTPPKPIPAATGLADLPPLDDLGGLTALDELPSLDGLNPLGADPLGDPFGGTADLGALATQTAAPARAQISPATVAAVQAAQDSRTTLFVGIGIGGVALLVVVIGLAVVLWPRGDGMKEFQAAEQAYQEKQYAAAIEKYDALLRSHPRHEQTSLIRVHRGLCKIHAASGSPADWARLLPMMKETAVPLAAEPALTQVHAELAPLLVQMTEALAAAATNPKIDEQTASRWEEANAALALCNDSRLLPVALRPWQKLAQIEERLQIVARELARNKTGDQVKAAVAQALSAGNLNAAFQERAKLLRAYPELASDELWVELAPQFIDAAVKSVKTNSDKRPASSESATSPLLFAQPWQLLNARLQTNTPPVNERVVLVHAASAIHALDAGNGQPRWSRYLASSPSDRPLLSADNQRTWLVDHQRNELLSLQAVTGKLLWRQSLGETPSGSPLLVGDKIVLTLATGKVQSFDAESGELKFTAELPQAALLGPVATDDGQLLQLGDEGLLYVMNATDLKCIAAHYVGHDRGQLLVPPVMFQRQIVLALQRGEQTEVLTIMADAQTSAIQRQRVDGVIGAPLVATGKRLLISTTQGKVLVLEPGERNDPLKLAQTLPATDLPMLRLLQATPDGIIAVDRGLAQFKFDAAGQLQPGWSAFPADWFDGGGHVHDQSLITARYHPDQSAIIAASVNLGDGLANWQTPLHTLLTLLAGEEGSQPVAVPASAVARLLTLAGENGDLSAEFKTQLSQSGHVNLQAPALGTFIAIGAEQLLTPPPGARELVLVKPFDFSVRKLKLANTLAGQPALCGQNLLVPLRDGSIHFLNPANGAISAAPFLLPAEQGSTPAALSVIALDEAGKEALVSDGVSTIVRINLVTEPQPHWVEQAAVRLSETLAAPPVALAEVVMAADRRGQVQVYSLPDLRAAQAMDLKSGRVTWGPHRAGDCVLLATDHDELWCCDATRQPRWLQSLAAGRPVGVPQLHDDQLVLVSASGQVDVRSAESGEVTASVKLEQPLAGSVLLSGNHLWLSTRFGQVLQIAIPGKAPQP